MVYTVVNTIAANDDTIPWLITDWNTYIRDNFMATVPGAFLLKGDMMVASGTAAGSVLHVGENNTMLVSDSTEPIGMKWAFERIREVITKKGDVAAATGAEAVAVVSTTWEGCRLVVDSTTSTGLAWKDPGAKTSVSMVRQGYTNHAGIYVPYLNSSEIDNHVIQTVASAGAAHQWAIAETGVYLITLTMVDEDEVVPTAGQYLEYRVYKDTTEYSVLAMHIHQTTGNVMEFYDNENPTVIRGGISGVDLLSLTAGDVVHIGITNTSALPLTASGRVTLTKVG